MGWGRLYAVNESASQLLSKCRTKPEWYEAMNTLGIHNAPQFDAEDSIRFWAAKFDSIGHPAAKFFAGDLRAEHNGSNDPNICFVGNESARVFLSQLEQLGKQFFVGLFSHDGPRGVGHSWLYDPLCIFLREACAQGNAVMILWEN